MNRAEIEIAVLQEAKNRLNFMIENLIWKSHDKEYGIQMAINELEIMIDETQND
jgi:hypothetical protein